MVFFCEAVMQCYSDKVFRRSGFETYQHVVRLKCYAVLQ